MSIDKIKHTAFVYSEGRGCTHNHTRVWVIRKYHCQTTFMISRITTHTHTLTQRMITACVCSVNHKLSELSCPTHWFLQLTTSSLSYLSSQWKHFLFLFVTLLVTANRSQCELRAASTKLHWRIDIWSDIKSSKIPSIRIGLRHSACTRTRRRKWRWNM